MNPQFKSAYQGESEYRIGDYTVAIRYFADSDRNWNTGVWDREIRPAIGTLRLRYNHRTDKYASQEFPPADIAAHFPDFEPMRFAADWTVEYQTAAPETAIDPGTKTIWAMRPLRQDAARFDWMDTIVARIENRKDAR